MTRSLTAFSLLFCAAAARAVTTVGDVEIAKTSDDANDMLYVFKTSGSLELSSAVKAQLLLVGGGGGGASTVGQSLATGSGGGGGAGGMVEVASKILGLGTYTVTVGAGGAGGAAGGENAGTKGGDSAISLAGVDLEIPVAVGGGGGAAANTVGGAGGSGGGGSGSSASGGVGESGQGNKGGNGQNSNSGAGGGGAGKPGGNTTANNTGAPGGAGKESTITGKSDFYAGGGGGGSRQGTVAASGGQGGGGDGATRSDPAGNGVPNTGGGGGGGSRYYDGGAGGSGVVIVRILETMPEKPPAEVSFVYDGTEHVIFEASPIGQYTITDSTGAVVNRIAAQNVGANTFTVTLNDDRVWADGDTTKTVECKLIITPPKLVIHAFSLEGWQVGERPSDPVLVSTPTLTSADYRIWYQRTGSTVKEYDPTSLVAGEYTAGLEILPSNNFDAPDSLPSPVSFTVWDRQVPSHDIDALGYSATLTVTGSSSEATDKLICVTLAENSPLGFHYRHARANGSDLRFLDAEGTNLAYHVESWNPNGETKVWVQLRDLQENTVITLFWGELADKTLTLPFLPGPTTGADDGETLTFSPTSIRPDSTFKNRWVEAPSYSGSTTWQAGMTPPDAPTVFAGVPAYGASYYVFANVSGAPLTNAVPTLAGEYLVKAQVPAGGDEGGTRKWTALDEQLNTVLLTASSPYQDLGNGSDMTSSGRVLLVNDFDNGTQKIVDQSYWLTNLADSDAGSYWVHSADTTISSLQPYIKTGTMHELVHAREIDALCGAKTLWYLENVLIGNTYPPSLATAANKNFLPWSLYAKAFSEKDGPVGAQAESAHLLLRNTVDAAIYSPCYTNGIGTIYFDAVNGLTSIDDGAGYRLVLEIATNTVASGLSFIPSDANVQEIIPAHTADGVLIPAVTNRFGFAVWHPVEMQPLIKNGTTGFVPGTATKDLALAINNGGSYENFYRVYAKIDYRGPVRFRLRRVSTTTDGEDVAVILVDNIAVSYPAMRVDLAPEGFYDATKAGKQTLGQELAWEIPFPSVQDDGLKARAKAVYSTNPGATVETEKLVLSAKMFYRWRYLNQFNKPWGVIGLDPSRGFSSQETLTLPEGLVGDVEFWYELRLNAPFYEYYDYSGANLNLGGLYSENISAVTNRSTITEMKESCGTDWFVRLREGQSDYEAVNLVLRTGTVTEEVEVEPGVTNTVVTDITRTIPMELVDNHIWRGYLPTPMNVAPRIEYCFELLNRQTPGSRVFETNTNVWFNGSSLNTVPVNSVLEDASSSNWTPLALDPTTGYLMFQVDDRIRTVDIRHADYQNFNSWADAKGEYFVVSSGGSRKKEYTGDFTQYLAMPSTSPTGEWSVPSPEWTDAQHMGNIEAYKPFQSDTSGAWQVGPGMWVSKWFKDDSDNAGVALQLEGQGRGYLQLTERDYLPRGIETISFNARLAQSINFTDFSYSLADSALSMTNYTFTTRAAFDVNENKNFSGNASLSLVAYYRPGVGCYELRVEQELGKKDASGKITGALANGLRVSLYRWRYDSDGSMKAVQLGSYASADLGSLTMQNTSSANLTYTPLYISVSNDVGATYISVGVGQDGMRLFGALSTLPNLRFAGLCYKDTSLDRLKNGTYGVLSANCEGVFLEPYQLKAAVSVPGVSLRDNRAVSYYRRNNLPFVTTGFHDCHNDLQSGGWFVTPGRMESVYSVDGTIYRWGLRCCNSISQNISVYTAPVGTTKWEKLKTFTVSGFGSSASSSAAYAITPYLSEPCSIRLSVDGNSADPRRDVVIDSFEVRQWAGDDWINVDRAYVPPKPSSGLDEWSYSNFVFTSGWTLDGSLLLSAKRTPSGKLASIRSPLMDGRENRGIGLGMFSYEYRNAKPTTRLFIQIAVGTNWTTIATHDFSTMTDVERKSGMRSVYIGRRGVAGEIRLIFDPDVVDEAQNSTDPDYGSIEILKVFCRDEPNVDERSWWGWNLRTVGPDTNGIDDEKKMYLPDLTRSSVGETGLSCALNNSIDRDVSVTDADAYREHIPFVQTPTFGMNLVGSIMFRARNYPGDTSTAYVGIYGAKSGLVEDDREWKFLTNIVVNASTYKIYTYTTDPGKAFAAFRLAVTGVEGVASVRGPTPEGGAQRVLLDEIVVTEAVKSDMGLPQPEARTIVIRATVDTAFGPIFQTVGETEKTADNLEIVLACGDAVGTNIVYQTDRWHVLDSVTTNGVVLDVSGAQTGLRTYTVNVGSGVSNDVTVVARARVNDDLSEKYGLTGDNPFAPAVRDWLCKGRTLRGSFAHPDDDVLSLAEFQPLDADEGVPMTLTEMYWLDMDPTVSNLVLKGGMSKAPEVFVTQIQSETGWTTVTNVRLGVKLYVTNRTDESSSPYYGKAWTPYALRGVAPDSYSIDAQGSAIDWSGATFKVRGFPAAALGQESDSSSRTVLRNFVFTEQSFMALEDAVQPGEATIDLLLPDLASSTFFFDWSLDAEASQIPVEPLKTENP